MGPAAKSSSTRRSPARAPNRDHTPLVFYKPGEWKRRVIGEENEGIVHGIFIVDWDGDGRDEILTASFQGVHVYHLEKSGAWKRTPLVAGDPAPWPKSGASEVAVARVDKERILVTLEPWHGNQIAVYHKRGKTWQRNVIDDSLVDGHTLVTADLDGDGGDEIVAGFRGKGQSVYYYTSHGDKWTRHTLDDGNMAAAACAVADLNGDARPDIACIGSATANLKWYENRWGN